MVKPYIFENTACNKNVETLERKHAKPCSECSICKELNIVKESNTVMSRLNVSGWRPFPYFWEKFDDLPFCAKLCSLTKYYKT